MLLISLFVAVFNGLGIILGGLLGLSVVLTAIILIIIRVVVLRELYAQLAYKYWKYDFGSKELKTEKGIIWKIYKSIHYERVQNVEIRRGIFARMLGFSTLDVQTAGYSAYGGRGGRRLSEGHIPAVDVQEAERIGTDLMKKIWKRSGL